MNAVEEGGLPILSLAAASGHLECIGMLVENGAGVNAQTKRSGTLVLPECASQSLRIISSSVTVLGTLHCTSVFAKGLLESTALKHY